MKKLGFFMLVGLIAVSCNNAGNSTKTTDSTAAKDNTNMYDTGVGSSATDTSHPKDTSLLPNKNQDTGMKH